MSKQILKTAQRYTITLAMIDLVQLTVSVTTTPSFTYNKNGLVDSFTVPDVSVDVFVRMVHNGGDRGKSNGRSQSVSRLSPTKTASAMGGSLHNSLWHGWQSVGRRNG